MFQPTFGDRLRKIARENGERELARYRYNRLSNEGKDRHAWLSKEIDRVHTERDQLLKENKFDEAKSNLAYEMELWDEMIDLMTGKKEA